MMEGERRSSDDLNGDSHSKHAPAWKKDDTIDIIEDNETRYNILLQNDQNIERKIPVDRRKLERLILAGSKDNESAEQYFQHVMDSSGTMILWPSRLKIGAKSKKDPQVKIVGTLDSVSKARDMLLNDLDTRSNRVTLKVNIAYNEHSHVIGREGSNIKKVHAETQCHIHFPDSNRYSQGEKSDQVSITGLYPAVEIARKRVRELQPIVVSLTLPIHTQLNIDHNSPDMVKIAQTYNITVHIKPQTQLMSMLVTVKGTVKFVEGLKLAIGKIVEYFTGDVHFIPPVMLYTDIAQQHHHTILGREGGNLQGIMHETCTSVQMPDSHGYYRSSQVTISGPLENAIDARNRLMGCLPVALLFDVTDDDTVITDAFIGDLMSKLDIFLNIKPKAKQNTQSVIVKSIEQNMECVYEARRVLCDYASNASYAMPIQQKKLVQLEEVEENVELLTTTPSPSVLDTKQQINDSVELRPSGSSPTSLITATTDVSVVRVAVKDTITVIPSVYSQQQQQQQSPLMQSNSHNDNKQNMSLSGSQSRLTVRHMIDYDKKKKQAEMALQAKVDPNIKRYPTDKFAGVFLSSSMPQQPKEPPINPSSGPVAKGLESLHRSSFQALMNQADLERNQAITQEQNVYEGITDLCTLLSHLGLEKYETNFAEEEIDFETFLTMSENDLKEVGVTTLGARRKIQIAIAEIKKLNNQPEKSHKVTPPIRSSLARLSIPSASLIGSSSHSKSTRVGPGLMNMSRSVRF